MSDLSFQRTPGALHVFDGEAEILEFRAGGDCIIRSVAPDGTSHVYVQHHPDLLRMLASDVGGGTHFGICVVDLPAAIAERFVIPSIIALHPRADSSARLLLAREKLEICQLNLLRRYLEPFAGVLNENRLFKAVPRTKRSTEP